MKKDNHQTDYSFTKFLSFSKNLNRLPIVLWVCLITSGAIFLTPTMSPRAIAYSALLSLSICALLFINKDLPINKRIRVLYDLIQLCCTLLLILIFGVWGLAYSVLFLSLLIFNAFKYSTKEYIAVFLMAILGLGILWTVQDISVFGNSDIKNIFFIVTANVFLATAILARVLAQESLVMQSKERSLLEQQEILRKENEEIKVVFNNMESAIIVLDKDNTISFANEKIIDIFALFRSRDESEISIDELMLIDPQGRKRPLREFVESNEECVYRSDLSIRIDSVVKNINLSISKSLDSKDKYNGAIVSIHNLNSDEILEKSKIEFSSLASHEIRTPLTAMDGYIYLMLNSDKFVFNDMTREYLSLLRDTTTDLIKLANSILQMSKLDDGSIRVDIEPVDLAEIINDASKNKTQSAEARGLTIDCNLSKTPIINTDKVKVAEIINNLIDNAIKFTNSGTIRLVLDQTGDELTVSVEDSGIGIPKDSKDKIFDKFYQVESYDTRKNSGSGLGLFLSRSLAKRIGGDLVLDETYNKGSKFSLVLPIKYPFPEDMKILKDKKLKEFIEGF